MLIYLDHALERNPGRARGSGAAVDAARHLRRHHEGAVERVRPKMMTVVAIIAGLLPIMWAPVPAAR